MTDYISALPTDLQQTLIHLYKICDVSFTLLSYTSRTWYTATNHCIKHHIHGTSFYLYGKHDRAIKCHEIAKKGYLEVLQWARIEGFGWDSETCATAARGGHLEVLQWARKNDCPWTNKVCMYAAEMGHLKVLEWSTNNGCEISIRDCYSWAARMGHLETLKWIYQYEHEQHTKLRKYTHRYKSEIDMVYEMNRCRADSRVCNWAASNGHLEVIKWARTEGFVWSYLTTEYAVWGEYREVYKWLWKNECDSHLDTIQMAEQMWPGIHNEKIDL